jgi:uncharacterized protein with von Willebrand factor type A (vWA) domain
VTSTNHAWRRLDPRAWAERIRAAERRSQRALRQVSDLRSRVSALEDEIQEARNLNKRLAEVIDVFVEVLVPAERRDPARLREALDRYTDLSTPNSPPPGPSTRQ